MKEKDATMDIVNLQPYSVCLNDIWYLPGQGPTMPHGVAMERIRIEPHLWGAREKAGQ